MDLTKPVAKALAAAQAAAEASGRKFDKSAWLQERIVTGAAAVDSSERSVPVLFYLGDRDEAIEVDLPAVVVESLGRAHAVSTRAGKKFDASDWLSDAIRWGDDLIQQPRAGEKPSFRLSPGVADIVDEAQRRADIQLEARGTSLEVAPLLVTLATVGTLLEGKGSSADPKVMRSLGVVRGHLSDAIEELDRLAAHLDPTQPDRLK